MHCPKKMINTHLKASVAFHNEISDTVLSSTSDYWYFLSTNGTFWAIFAANIQLVFFFFFFFFVVWLTNYLYPVRNISILGSLN